MAAISKAIGSLLHMSQETTLALANFSCDFSIIKIEAPKEYAGLGTTLSKKRIAEAEDGDIHTTARRLGSLFGQGLPDVSQFISAYGRRVTEIAAQASVNPRGSHSDGPFADHVGADGTTIWAAATSGTEAIAVHLLACILARIWPQGEAVSIWTELVHQKKKIIEQSFIGASTIHTSAVFLSRIHLSTEQLKAWDASARAWLRTADHAKRIQQTQLRLISDNISLPVSAESNVYEAVMKCWTTAMISMNDLIEGKPQSVQSGALLLALSAWHLYPDMSVQSPLPQFVKQCDPLVKQGGIITVGLNKRSNYADEGVYWSLPLAYLRIYGKPVMTTRNNGVNHTQVSFSQLSCLALGSMLSLWHVVEADLDDTLEFIRLLAQADLDTSSFSHSLTIDYSFKVQRSPLPWLQTLGRAAGFYLLSKGPSRSETAKLIAYGRRRCSVFLKGNHDHLPPFFGLAKVSTAFRLFLPYSNPKESPRHGAIHGRQVDFLRRWANNSTSNLTGSFIGYCLGTEDESYTSISEPRTGIKRTRSHIKTSSERIFPRWSPVIHRNALNETTRYVSPGPNEAPLECGFVFGDPQTVAIYRPGIQGDRVDCSLSPKELGQLLRDYTFNMDLIFHHIESKYCSIDTAHIESLQALEAAENIYKHLTDAKVDLQICLGSLRASHYSRRLRAQHTRASSKKLENPNEVIESLKVAFSCITLFETGHIDIDPEDLQGAMAISHGDSIFVAQNILLDPSRQGEVALVRRIVGNVGKAGLVILIPPQAPEVRERSLNDWRVVNHAPFDARYEDNFASTSLHLAFTGYELPVDVSQRGNANHEALFVETVISVYEGGEWVADLNVLKVFSSYEHGWTKDPRIGSKVKMPPLVSIDNWHEILDSPESSAIVRACGNEHARLATATVALQLGYTVRIIGPDDHPVFDLGFLLYPQSEESSSTGEIHNTGEHLPDCSMHQTMANNETYPSEHNDVELDSDDDVVITHVRQRFNDTIKTDYDDLSGMTGVLYIC